MVSPATGIAVPLRKVHPLCLGLCNIMMWNTRGLDDTVRQVYDTCFGRKANPNAVWSKVPCGNTQVSQRCWSVNCCVKKYAGTPTRKMRVKCVHVGRPSTKWTHTQGAKRGLGRDTLTHVERKEIDHGRSKRTHQSTFAGRLRL